MCSRDEQRAVPRGERPVVRIRRRTKRGVCARVSSFPELEAAGCRVMRSLYPVVRAQRSPDNHHTAATVIASAERIPYVAEDDSNFLSGGLSTLPPSCRHALVDEAPHVLSSVFRAVSAGRCPSPEEGRPCRLTGARSHGHARGGLSAAGGSVVLPAIV